MAANTFADDLLFDSLTGFGSREKLIADLATAVEPDSPPSLLVIFALAGFRRYVDLFGRLKSHELLVEMTSRLQLEPAMEWYRPREDELATIVHDRGESVKPLLEEAVKALTERGPSFSIKASRGAAMLPDETNDPLDALILADQRLSLSTRARESRERRTNEKR